jgi:formamidopyrimidine-DNA glycosylase
MPELPEAERARLTLETVLGREVAGVDDTDTYVCRPFSPGEIAGALHGHTFVAAGRQGKFLWLESGDGPTLGLHLGMAGRIVLDPVDRLRSDRFRVDFTDGSSFVLRDRRRLGRAVLNPSHEHLGPDAGLVTRAEFRRRVGRGRTPIKARLLDQGTISGVGNLLADEVLWQSRLSPRRISGELSEAELDLLRRQLRAALRSAHKLGGVHTGRFIRDRGPEGHCPRDGSHLERATIGGRTTYWCPACQP